MRVLALALIAALFGAGAWAQPVPPVKPAQEAERGDSIGEFINALPRRKPRPPAASPEPVVRERATAGRRPAGSASGCEAQLAALGVGHVVLTGAERVEHSYFSSHVLEEQVLKRELWRGLEQCGETLLPHVHLGSTRSLQRTLRALQPQEQQPDPSRQLAGAEVGQGLQLRAAASMREGEGCRLVAHPSPSEHEGAAVPAVASSGRLLLAIGPEGGWRAAELELLRQHNFATFSLGSRVLTTETATVALLSGLKSLANDW